MAWLPDPTTGRSRRGGSNRVHGTGMESRQEEGRDVGDGSANLASSDVVDLEARTGQESELDGLAEDDVDEVIVELERRLCGLLGCR